MKTKKSGVFAALAVVLLIAAALIASCVDPEDLNGSSASNNGNTGNFVPPTVAAGKSYIQINLGGSNGRTIMPDSANIAAFTKVIVTIRNQDTTTGTLYKTATAFPYDSVADLVAGDPDVIEVTPSEDFDITVDAYMVYTTGVGDGDVITATWTGELTDAGSGSNPINVALKGNHASGNGTFKWALTYNSVANFTSLDTATLDLLELDGTTTAMTQINLQSATGNATNSTGQSVPSGYYYVVVSLDAEGKVPVVFTDVIHIYGEMSSTFTKSFPTLVNLPTYTVTFKNWNATTDLAEKEIEYTHGEVMQSNAGYTSNSLGTIAGATFNGWFTATNGGGDAVPVTTKIYKAYTVFGKWTTIPTATINISFEDKGLPLNIVAGYTFTEAALQGTGAIITADISGVEDAVFVEWRIEGLSFNTATATFGYELTPDIAQELAKTTINVTLVITVNGETYTKPFTISKS